MLRIRLNDGGFDSTVLYNLERFNLVRLAIKFSRIDTDTREVVLWISLKGYKTSLNYGGVVKITELEAAFTGYSFTSPDDSTEERAKKMDDFLEDFREDLEESLQISYNRIIDFEEEIVNYFDYRDCENGFGTVTIKRMM